MRRSPGFNKIILFWFLLFEIIILCFTEIFKYFQNYPVSSLESLVSVLAKNYDFLYTGNLFWITIFLISVVCITNLFTQIDKVSDSAVKKLLLISLISFVILLVAILFPEGEASDSLLISLTAKGTRTLLLSAFALMKIFFTISLCVVSFSVLMKYYFFRSVWITILIALAGFLIVFLFAYNYKDDYTLLIENKKSVPAGTVLGAAVWGGNRPSPVLRERINKGYELYSSGIIKNIILTGGGSPGEMTEAEVSKKELLKKGVNEKNIIIENKSNSTLEQIIYLNNNQYKKNNWKETVIISDNFHLLRTKQICRFFGVNAYTVSSDTPLSTESTFNYCIKESFAVILFWLFGIG
ncbi:MAG TPA: ElyC/SanA/YdcF family protein [Ignavibacteria bacterium]|jgi:vancomycin permeability regulator SanA